LRNTWKLFIYTNAADMKALSFRTCEETIFVKSFHIQFSLA